MLVLDDNVTVPDALTVIVTEPLLLTLTDGVVVVVGVIVTVCEVLGVLDSLIVSEPDTVDETDTVLDSDDEADCVVEGVSDSVGDALGELVAVAVLVVEALLDSVGDGVLLAEADAVFVLDAEIILVDALAVIDADIEGLKDRLSETVDV